MYEEYFDRDLVHPQVHDPDSESVLIELTVNLPPSPPLPTHPPPPLRRGVGLKLQRGHAFTHTCTLLIFSKDLWYHGMYIVQVQQETPQKLKNISLFIRTSFQSWV